MTVLPPYHISEVKGTHRKGVLSIRHLYEDTAIFAYLEAYVRANITGKSQPKFLVLSKEEETSDSDSTLTFVCLYGTNNAQTYKVESTS